MQSEPEKEIGEQIPVQRWPLAAKNLFFPIFCQACGVRLHTEDNGFYCPDCWETVEFIAPPCCDRCGTPHESMVGYGAPINFPCSPCRTAPLPHVDRIYGALTYEGVLIDAIKLFKFLGKRRLAGPLVRLMEESLENFLQLPPPDLLLPVPLHHIRERSRGYNQSTLLAHGIMDKVGAAAYGEHLKRIRPTRTQSRLSGLERQGNLHGAFAVVGGDVEGRHLLLVDDVVTTGGTVVECAKTLKEAGAKRVDVFALALAVPHEPARVI